MSITLPFERASLDVAPLAVTECENTRWLIVCTPFNEMSTFLEEKSGNLGVSRFEQ